jgi:hypothetical protein
VPEPESKTVFVGRVPPPTLPQAPVASTTAFVALKPRQLTCEPVVTPENVNDEVKV